MQKKRFQNYLRDLNRAVWKTTDSAGSLVLKRDANFFGWDCLRAKAHLEVLAFFRIINSLFV
jgi:hypothetical protein